MLTTPFLGFLWWEWHSSKDLQDWPKYKFHIFSDGSVEDIIYYPRSGGLKLHARCEVIDESRIRLDYSEYTGDNVPLGYSTSVTMEIRRLDDSAYHKFALYAADEGGAPDLILLGDQAVRSNLNRKVQGIEVVTMGAVYGSATANVRIRTAPRVTASMIRFRSPEVAAGLGYCPKETGFHIIARTAQKERVREWTNYWYYVDIFTGRGMMPRYGWMFGQFIDFSEEEVRDAETLPAWERRSLEDGSESGQADPAMQEND